jgi:hypothetical protein
MRIRGEVPGAAWSAYTYWPWLRQNFGTTAAGSTDRLSLPKPNDISCNLLHLGYFLNVTENLSHVCNQTTLTGGWTVRRSKTTGQQLQPITYKKVILKRPVTLRLACSYLEGTQDLCTSPVSAEGDEMRHSSLTSYCKPWTIKPESRLH